MIGCDIIEIDRVKTSIEKFGDTFIARILTPNEIELYNKKGKKAEFIAGRFSVKESISKAFGCGIGDKLSFTDIEILPDDNGKPKVAIKGRERKDVNISISHSKYNAISMCHISEDK